MSNLCLTCLLTAIATVENGPETNRYQFQETTWTQHAEGLALTQASLTEQHAVAERHLIWIIETRKTHVPLALAVYWNAGVNVKKVTPKHLDYASRVTNIYNDEVFNNHNHEHRTH